MPDAWSLYSKKVIDHFQNPRNVGELENADGIGHVGNPICIDVMDLYIKVKDDIIVDAKFKAFGCGAAIATCSMITNMLKGKSIEEAKRALEESDGDLAKAILLLQTGG